MNYDSTYNLKHNKKFGIRIPLKEVPDLLNRLKGNCPKCKQPTEIGMELSEKSGEVVEVYSEYCRPCNYIRQISTVSINK